MSGTPLNLARFAGLMATVAKSFPLELLTDEVCQSWEDNGEELANRLVFLAQMAPEPKRKGKAKKPTLVNPAEFFVTSDKLYVDSSFTNIINLSPCANDTRELKVLFALPRNMNDTAIAKQAGGKKMLKVSVPQFLRECQLAISGGRSIFAKGGYYLVYLEDTDGGLRPVDVRWDGGRLYLHCARFDRLGRWRGGSQVCGN